MSRSTHNYDYQALLSLLRELRGRAGFTQVALAASLGSTQTFISKVERGERRIDVVEFAEICDALGVEPAVAFKELLDRRSPGARTERKLSGRERSSPV